MDNTTRPATSGGDTLRDVDSGVAKTQVMRLAANGQPVSRANPLPVASKLQASLWERFAAQLSRQGDQETELLGLMQQRIALTPVRAAPTVVAISPASGFTTGGTFVVIQVSDSRGARYATVGGCRLSYFSIVDRTHVSGMTCLHTAGAADVTVTNGTGTSSPLVGGFTYVSTFNPLSVASCVLWYDLAHRTTSGGSLTALPDQSGGGLDLVINSGSPAVTATNASYNNLPTVRRADATDVLITPVLGVATSFTLVMVGDSVAPFSYMFFNNVTGTELLSQTTIWRASSDGLNVVDVTATVTVPTVLIAVVNGASSRLYVSALTPTSGNMGSGDMSARGIFLGDATAPGSGGGDMNFAHALVYSSALSNTDCAYLLTGFGAMAGITIGP